MADHQHTAQPAGRNNTRWRPGATTPSSNRVSAPDANSSSDHGGGGRNTALQRARRELIGNALAYAKFGQRQILATAEALVKAEKRKIVAALTPVQLRAEIA